MDNNSVVVFSAENQLDGTAVRIFKHPDADTFLRVEFWDTDADEIILGRFTPRMQSALEMAAQFITGTHPEDM